MLGRGGDGGWLRDERGRFAHVLDALSNDVACIAEDPEESLCVCLSIGVSWCAAVEERDCMPITAHATTHRFMLR